MKKKKGMEGYPGRRNPKTECKEATLTEKGKNKNNYLKNYIIFFLFIKKGKAEKTKKVDGIVN